MYPNINIDITVHIKDNYDYYVELVEGSSADYQQKAMATVVIFLLNLNQECKFC